MMRCICLPSVGLSVNVFGMMHCICLPSVGLSVNVFGMMHCICLPSVRLSVNVFRYDELHLSICGSVNQRISV